ncbi:MAG: PTS IIA-like nitrogen regulatory protein PtsN [Pseudomonadota bacterium]
MDLATFLDRQNVLVDLEVASKKQLLQALADHVGETGILDQREVFNTVFQREKLGSTGVGAGVAIPHGKFQNLNAIVGYIAKLREPIEFDALDDAPVDLVFLLLAPEDAGADHLKALSRIARVLRDKNRVAQVRASSDAEVIYDLLVETPASNAA